MSPERHQQIGKLYHDVLELEPGERGTFLAEACAGDHELRREVESLVAANDQLATFLDKGALAAAASLLVEDHLEFSVGQRIAQYEIIAPLGAGGMGEVYLADDRKLGRRLALKILPAYFTKDPQRVRRFKQEAQAVIALNHPNIVTIYDIGQAGEIHYIATELIEGETLRQRAGSAGLKLNGTIEIAIQITSALVAAHQAGVVHRDIKPDNIMLRTDGYVKVLDFGLAKLLEKPRTVSTDSTIATRLLVKTDAGVVMGTASYMSPEQARGADMDARTDIWSLGVVLYELATGRLPFEGATPAEAIARIIEREPTPLVRYAPDLPAEFERIVTKALTKDREERYQTAKDLLIDLKRLKQRLEVDSEIERVRTPESSIAATPNHQVGDDTTSLLKVVVTGPHPTSSAQYLVAEIKRHKTGVLVGALVGTLAVVALGFGLYRLFGTGRISGPASALKTSPFTSFPGYKGWPSFSPDGKQIAFVWNPEKEHNPDIYVKLIGEGSPLRLTTDPHPDRTPTWSPDGRLIAFVRQYETEWSLMTVPALGGAERKLYTSPQLVQIDWSPDAKHLVVADGDAPGGLTDLYLVSAETGEKKKLTQTPSQFNGDRAPRYSPDGKSVAFIRSSNFAVDDVYIAPIEGGQLRRVTNDGHEISGIAWAADGLSIIFSSNRGGSYGLWRISLTEGSPQPVPGAGENAFQPAVSRAGGYLAYTSIRSDTNIWRAPGPNAKEKGNPTKLIASTRGDGSPSYSPDGKRIAFSSDRTGGTEVWVCDSEGQNQTQLTRFGGHAGSPSWSPDGKEIVLDARPEGSSDIYIVGAEGGAPRRLTSEPSAEITPVWSKDGHWIFFGSDWTGEWQIWKMPAAGGPATQVTKGGGYAPLEAIDQYIYYGKKIGLPAKNSNEPGVWRVPLAGGDEVRVFDQGSNGTTSVTVDGICLFNLASTSSPTIDFYRFASRQMSNILSIDRSKSGGFGRRLSVSPDGQWLIYVQTDQVENDIMLVENFVSHEFILERNSWRDTILHSASA